MVTLPPFRLAAATASVSVGYVAATPPSTILQMGEVAQMTADPVPGAPDKPAVMSFFRW